MDIDTHHPWMSIPGAKFLLCLREVVGVNAGCISPFMRKYNYIYLYICCHQKRYPFKKLSVSPVVWFFPFGAAEKPIQFQICQLANAWETKKMALSRVIGLPAV